MVRMPMNWEENRKSSTFLARNGAVLLVKRVSYWGIGAQPIRSLSKSEVSAATNNYSHRINERYWTVKGRLPNGPAVAVTVIQGSIEQAIEQIAILSGITHPNVVNLLACCLETELPILVHEFIPGGTLHQRLELHGHGAPLHWSDRVRIAGEIADALNYLHTFSSMPIVHRNITTDNILLDEKGTAKVAGFHISVHISKPDGEEMQVEGKFGWIDPEYVETGILSDKSDVYSFGVLLLTLVVGKEPSNVPFEYVSWFAYRTQNGQLREVVEPSILQKGKMEDILAFVEVALSCLHKKREDRPTMKDVVTQLRQINCTGH